VKSISNNMEAEVINFLFSFDFSMDQCDILYCIESSFDVISGLEEIIYGDCIG